jgi:tetratricopeptide (TPR) repeat protein
MRTALWIAAIAACAPAAESAAQQFREGVAAGQPTQYRPPRCGIKTGHFLVSASATKLSVALGSNNPANRERLLREGVEVLHDAITTKGQATNPAAWYYLGRIDLYRGDVEGADTALARAETLAPACKDEIREFRRPAWRALVGAGLQYQQENKPDSALWALRLGSRLMPGEPEPHYLLGTIHETAAAEDSAIAQFRQVVVLAPDSKEGGAKFGPLAVDRMGPLLIKRGETDSGIAYLQQSVAIATRGGDVNAMTAATQRLAVGLYLAKRYPEAIPALRRYLTLRPDDAASRRYLASAYEAVGQADSASAVLGQARAAAGGGGGGGGPDTLAPPFLINRGVGHYQARRFADAAADFAKALEREPHHRVALLNLAYAYNELKDGPHLLQTAERLMEREPFHETAHRLEVQAYVHEQNRAKGLEAVRRLDALPVAVDSLKLQPGPAKAVLSGVIRGRAATNPDKTPVKPAPITLVFELLDAQGGVVATSEVAVPALAPDARHPLAIEAAGTGIVDWRYRRR